MSVVLINPFISAGESSSQEYHLFCVAGQSNAEGRGDSALSPTVDTGAAYEYTGGTLVQLQDPVGGADTGSAWPAFAQTYHDLTGHIPVIVETAAGGSSQTAAGDVGSGNWDTSGALRGAAVTAINAALSYLSSQGYPNAFKGFLWSQGEADGNAINAATIDQSDYQTALETMLTYFRTQFGGTMPFYMIQTGRRTSGDSAGYADVRETQETVAAAQADTHLAFTGAVDFPDQELMSDDVHYNQIAYNLIGVVVGNYVAGNRAPTAINLSKTTIREDAPIGEAVGTLSAMDPNPSDTHTFSIVSDPDSKFSIDGNVLELAATVSFPGSHSVTIRATDSGGATFDQPFTITVLDVVTDTILLSGDAQSGTDELLLDGDAQSGTDVILYREVIE